MKKIFLINAFLCLFLGLGIAQNTSNQSVKQDSTPSPKESGFRSSTVKKAIGDAKQVKTDTFPKKIAKKGQAATDSFPIPRMAALWSLLPGGGQIYNKKWAVVKVPIVYAALGTTIYFTAFNQKIYRKYKQADYNLRNSVDPDNPQSGFPDIPNKTSPVKIRERRDAFYKSTQQMYILTGVTYILAAAEAFTTAHLAHFDVSDDLSFRVKPSFEPVGVTGNAFGAGIQIRF